MTNRLPQFLPIGVVKMLQSRSRREYRVKAFDCLSRAESIDDPEKRADMLALARMWMSLGEPLGDIPGAYEYSSQSHKC